MTLLKDSIPMRTWAEWDEATPGFVEIDPVAQEGEILKGKFYFILDITGITTGWTETVSVKNTAQKWVFASLKTVTAKSKFPILGIDSDNGSEFIDLELLRWREQEELALTGCRSGNADDGAHLEQRNWNIMGQTAGWHR